MDRPPAWTSDEPSVFDMSWDQFTSTFPVIPYPKPPQVAPIPIPAHVQPPTDTPQPTSPPSPSPPTAPMQPQQQQTVEPQSSSSIGSMSLVLSDRGMLELPVEDEAAAAPLPAAAAADIDVEITSPENQPSPMSVGEAGVEPIQRDHPPPLSSTELPPPPVEWEMAAERQELELKMRASAERDAQHASDLARVEKIPVTPAWDEGSIDMLIDPRIAGMNAHLQQTALQIASRVKLPSQSATPTQALSTPPQSPTSSSRSRMRPRAGEGILASLAPAGKVQSSVLIEPPRFGQKSRYSSNEKEMFIESILAGSVGTRPMMSTPPSSVSPAAAIVGWVRGVMVGTSLEEWLATKSPQEQFAQVALWVMQNSGNTERRAMAFRAAIEMGVRDPSSAQPSEIGRYISNTVARRRILDIARLIPLSADPKANAHKIRELFGDRSMSFSPSARMSEFEKLPEQNQVMLLLKWLSVHGTSTQVPYGGAFATIKDVALVMLGQWQTAIKPATVGAKLMDSNTTDTDIEIIEDAYERVKKGELVSVTRRRGVIDGAAKRLRSNMIPTLRKEIETMGAEMESLSARMQAAGEDPGGKFAARLAQVKASRTTRESKLVACLEALEKYTVMYETDTTELSRRIVQTRRSIVELESQSMALEWRLLGLSEEAKSMGRVRSEAIEMDIASKRAEIEGVRGTLARLRSEIPPLIDKFKIAHGARAKPLTAHMVSKLMDVGKPGEYVQRMEPLMLAIRDMRIPPPFDRTRSMVLLANREVLKALAKLDNRIVEYRYFRTILEWQVGGMVRKDELRRALRSETIFTAHRLPERLYEIDPDVGALNLDLLTSRQIAMAEIVATAEGVSRVTRDVMFPPAADYIANSVSPFLEGYRSKSTIGRGELRIPSNLVTAGGDGELADYDGPRWMGGDAFQLNPSSSHHQTSPLRMDTAFGVEIERAMAAVGAESSPEDASVPQTRDSSIDIQEETLSDMDRYEFELEQQMGAGPMFEIGSDVLAGSYVQDRPSFIVQLEPPRIAPEMCEIPDARPDFDNMWQIINTTPTVESNSLRGEDAYRLGSACAARPEDLTLVAAAYWHLVTNPLKIMREFDRTAHDYSTKDGILPVMMGLSTLALFASPSTPLQFPSFPPGELTWYNARKRAISANYMLKISPEIRMIPRSMSALADAVPTTTYYMPLWFNGDPTRSVKFGATAELDMARVPEWSPMPDLMDARTNDHIVPDQFIVPNSLCALRRYRTRVPQVIQDKFSRGKNIVWSHNQYVNRIFLVNPSGIGGGTDYRMGRFVARCDAVNDVFYAWQAEEGMFVKDSPVFLPRRHVCLVFAPVRNESSGMQFNNRSVNDTTGEPFVSSPMFQEFMGSFSARFCMDTGKSTDIFEIGPWRCGIFESFDGTLRTFLDGPDVEMHDISGASHTTGNQRGELYKFSVAGTVPYDMRFQPRPEMGPDEYWSRLLTFIHVMDGVLQSIKSVVFDSNPGIFPSICPDNFVYSTHGFSLANVANSLFTMRPVKIGSDLVHGRVGGYDITLARRFDRRRFYDFKMLGACSTCSLAYTTSSRVERDCATRYLPYDIEATRASYPSRHASDTFIPPGFVRDATSDSVVVNRVPLIIEQTIILTRYVFYKMGLCGQGAYDYVAATQATPLPPTQDDYDVNLKEYLFDSHDLGLYVAHHPEIVRGSFNIAEGILRACSVASGGGSGPVGELKSMFDAIGGIMDSPTPFSAEFSPETERGMVDLFDGLMRTISRAVDIVNGRLGGDSAPVTEQMDTTTLK